MGTTERSGRNGRMNGGTDGGRTGGRDVGREETTVTGENAAGAGAAGAGATLCWTIVVPVKALRRAKSRLNRPDRAAVALAMARDSVAAAVAAPGVGAVVVVTDDPQAARALAGPRVWVIEDA